MLPTSLPVPSKAALRTLRTLALGTTCTVAFTAGILTADRRRRIHAAREVLDNARKLKSTRQYHNGANAVIGNLEDAVATYGERVWLSRGIKESIGEPEIQQLGDAVITKLSEKSTTTPAKSKVLMTSGTGKKVTKPRSQLKLSSTKSKSGLKAAKPPIAKGDPKQLADGLVPAIPVQPGKSKNLVPSKTAKMDTKHTGQSKWISVKTEIGRKVVRRVTPETCPRQLNDTLLQSVPVKPAESRSTKAGKRHAAMDQKRLAKQQEIAHDMLNILEDESHSSKTKFAWSKVLDAFGCDTLLGASGICDHLSDAMVRFLNHCATQHSSINYMISIFCLFVKYGKDSDGIFSSINSEPMIRALLESSHLTEIQPPSSNPTAQSESAQSLGAERSIVEALHMPTIMKLHLACNLYASYSHQLPSYRLGKILCAEASRQNSLSSIRLVFEKLCLDTTKDSYPEFLTTLLVIAHKSGHHSLVRKIFQYYFLSTSPTQSVFRKATGTVGLSLLEVKEPLKNDAILLSMLAMADREKLTFSTTICLRILDRRWKLCPRLDHFRPFFDSIVPLFGTTNHPQQLYSAIIQHCVSTDNERLAIEYYRRLRERFAAKSKDIRIYGHLAHAKARRQDWSGVRQDFHFMKSLMLTDFGLDAFSLRDLELDYSATFVPVLRRFSECHTINETEIFVREYIEDFDILLTPNISQIMLERYIQNREIDSVTRWITYMMSAGAEFGPEFFNKILVECAKHWRFSFEEAFQVFQSVADFSDWKHGFINNNTYTYLRHLATASPKNRAEKASILNHLGSRLIPYFPGIDLEVTERLKTSLASRKYGRVLSQYQFAVKRGLALRPSALSYAVNASLQLNPESTEGALLMIKEAKEHGQEVFEATSAVVMHQLKNSKYQSPAEVLQVARIVISSLDANRTGDKSRPVQIVSYMISALSDGGKHRAAVDYWEYVSSLECQPPIQINISILTSLLQAYLGSKNAVGVTWAMNALQEKSLIPDEGFKRALYEARRVERNYSPERCTRFERHVDHAIGIMSDILAEASREKAVVRDKIILIMEKAIEHFISKKKDAPDQEMIVSSSNRAARRHIELDNKQIGVV